MQIIKNFWLRWFACGIVLGVALIPLCGVVYFVRLIIEARSETLMPVTLISNPFIDIITPSGIVIATGNAAMAITILVLSLTGGILGLGVAAVKSILWRPDS